MEIEKLRLRLKNVHKNSTEYKMTVKEAQELLAEIDARSLKAETASVSVATVAEAVPKPNMRVFDGGGF